MSETCPSLGRRMAITMVSVRNEPPGLRSEPINRKLTVSCPLLSTWLPEGSMVDSGASVLANIFGSMVGNSVCVGAGLGVSVTGLNVGEGKNVPVGVQGTGWKGDGVAEAFGAAVTNVKGSGCAWAETKFPHPASSKLARSTIRV